MRRLAALWLFCVWTVQAAPFEARVITVLDGDTLLVQSGPFQSKLRLVNIDAPEKAQPFGLESQQSLQALVGGKTVQVESRAVDQYQRTLAVVSVEGLNVNEEQVRRGLAWAYSRSREARRYTALQAEAQAARRGLWQQADPERPSQWRKQHPLDVAAHPSSPPPRTAHPSDPQSRRAQIGMLACGKKHYCSQMVACDEAHYYLTVCGEARLDPDRDGVPCEALCVGR